MFLTCIFQSCQGRMTRFERDLKNEMKIVEQYVGEQRVQDSNDGIQDLDARLCLSRARIEMLTLYANTVYSAMDRLGS